MNRAVVLRRLGCVEYQDGLDLMKSFAAARRVGLAPDTLFLLEHPDVITLGRGGKRAHLLCAPEELVARGVELFETDRGGDVTWHGPGQVVGYPVFDLAPDRKDVRRYVRDLEETMIRAAAAFGVEAHRSPGHNGAWVGNEKLGALGVHLSRWITTHGFAFNADPDLSRFGLIVPCGIRDKGVTSLGRLLGRRVDRSEAEEALARAAAEVFDVRLEERGPEMETVQVVVTRSGSSGTEVLMLRRTGARGGFWQQVTGRVELGETPQQAATRELYEETGLVGAPAPLGYVHAFALDPRIHPGDAPRVGREHAFAFAAPAGARPRIDPREHDEALWVPAAEAAARVPYAGLRKGILLAAGRD